MKLSQTDEFKAVHKEMLLLLEDMKYDHTMVDAHFITRVKTISTVLGVLIERVEGEDENDVADLRDKTWERYNNLTASGKIHHVDVDEVPDCPKCHVAHYPNCEQQGKAKDTPELKITGQDRTMCPYKICLKEKCEFYPNDCSVIRAHKREVEP